MNPSVGAVAQLAYIVRPGGLDRAIDYWVGTMGAGPFFVGSFPLSRQLYHGAPTDQDAVVACGYLGEVQIELIDPTPDAPGVYTDFLRRNPDPPIGGLYHHVMLDDGDYDATIARLVAGGCRVAFTAVPPDGGRLAYLEAYETTGGYVEVLESDSWPHVVAGMKAARRDWDGRDPVRPFAALA